MNELAKLSISTFSKLLDAYKNYKREKLFERLKNSELTLSDDDVKSDPFISTFIKTDEAIQIAESEEKLDYLISLYMQCIADRLIFDKPDLYHETLNIIGDMSIREIYFVYILDDFQRKNIETENNFQEFNGRLLEVFKDKLGINYDDVQSLTRRLYRTGLIMDRPTMGEGIWPRVSPSYKYVLDFIHNKIENQNRLPSEKA